MSLLKTPIELRKRTRSRCFRTVPVECPDWMVVLGRRLMENRSALIEDMELTQADGWAEREAAAQMLRRPPKRKRRRTVAADRA